MKKLILTLLLIFLLVGKGWAICEEVDQQQTGTNTPSGFGNMGGADIYYLFSQSFQLSAELTITAVGTREGNAKTGNPTGNWTLRIETDDGSGNASGTLADPNASVVVSPPGTNTEVKGTFATSFVLSGGTTYHFVHRCDAQTSGNYWNLSWQSGQPYANGFAWYSLDDGDTWDYVGGSTYDQFFKIYVDTCPPSAAAPLGQVIWIE